MLDVQILAARRLDRLAEIKSDLESKYGVSVTIGALDLTDPASGDAFYENLPAKLRDSVDVLVNNAGSGTIPAPVWESNWDELNSVIDTNVKGVVKTIKLFVPGMLKRQTGHIINISSVLGKESVATSGLYAGTKFMLEAITTSLRAELVATPLRVSIVSPGLTQSEFTTSLFKGNEDVSKKVYEGIRALDSADIADGIVYTASRPPHVQVVDLVIYSTSQASVSVLHREKPADN